MKKTEAIAKFLRVKTREDLANLYHEGMECQVNTAQDGGERMDGHYNGRAFTAWTDGEQVWKAFRIPWKANSEPEYRDSEIKFNLADHAEAIGMTGWDWQARASKWVAYDFDAIVGHSENHTQKLSDSELQKVQNAACAIPWVTVRKSTSGRGLHLYVFLPAIPTGNHTEHAALAKAILAKMSALAGYDFQGKVDNCGGNFWVWHRKMDEAGGLEGDGLKVVKQGDILTDIPINWRDHLTAASGKKSRSIPSIIEEKEVDWFEELCGKHTRVPLDDVHKKVMQELDTLGALWWYDNERHMIVCHTKDLEKIHKKLELRGLFRSDSSQGSEQNCFAFPLTNGAFVVRRHTKGVKEAATWEVDQSGWTRCYYNREPDLRTAALSNGATEDDGGIFVFEGIEAAVATIKVLGGDVKGEIPESFKKRSTALKIGKDSRRLVIELVKEDGDPDKIPGWVYKLKRWRRLIDITAVTKYEEEVSAHDDIVRHLVSSQGGDAGWAIYSDSEWVEEPYVHVKAALRSMGYSAKEADLVLGHGVIRRWKIVNIPFGVEYPGDRLWNRGSVQLRVTPTPDRDDLSHPTWDKVLNHTGSGLDVAIKANEWCKTNGILTGGEYLKLWIASMIQRPFEPLPYLFFHGPQGSGKSVFHESISQCLLDRGVVRADTALTSQQNFNGELASAILCVVEETDLSKTKGVAYNRIKDWTTGRMISVHTKGETPYSAPNSMHWCQMANNMEECPIFPGDTRITMIYVPELSRDEYIAKRDLERRLKDEAPDFLASVMSLEIPYAKDRLSIPIIDTDEKRLAAKANQSEMASFIEDQCHIWPGKAILWAEFFEKFQEWLDPPKRQHWTKRRAGQQIPPPLVKGRNMRDKAQYYVANVSFEPPPEGTKMPSFTSLDGETLVGLTDFSVF